MANAALQRRDDDSDLPMGSLTPFPQQTQQAPAPVAVPVPDDSDLPMGSLTPFPQQTQQAPAPVPVPPVPTRSISDIFTDTAPGAFAGLPGVPEQTEGPGAMPVPPPDPRVGAAQSALDAMRDVRNESWQLARGDAFDPNQPIPPPVDRTFGGKIAYGLAKTSPTLAGMALGAAGGAELGAPAGPWGGVIGGALGGVTGGGVMAFTQELIPAYQDARRRGLNHEQSTDEAYKVAATSGILTGATAPLFSLRYVKNIVGDILLKTAVTGPAVGAAGQIATPMVTGQPMPTGEEMLEGYLQNAAGGAILAGAHHAIPRIIDRFRPDTRPNLDLGTPPTEQGPGALGGPAQPPPVPPVGPAPASVEPPWRRSGYDANAGPPAVEGPFGQLFTPGQEPPPIPPVQTSPASVPAPWRRGADPTGSAPVEPTPTGTEAPPAPVSPVPVEPITEPPPVPPPAAPVVVPSPEPIPTTGQEPDGQLSTTRPPNATQPVTTEPVPTDVPGTGTTGVVPVAPVPEPVAAPTTEPAVVSPAGGDLPAPGVEPLTPTPTPTPTTPAEPEGAQTPVPAEPTAAAPATPEPPAKRPVSEAEHSQLRTDLANARKALDNAIRKNEPQEKIEKLKARVAETGAAYDNAEGPPTRPTFILGGKSRQELMAGHEAAAKAHEAAVTQRIHTEGETPVADPKGVARVFTKDIVTATPTITAVVSTDTKGNAWAGSGNVMTRDPVMVKAAEAASKKSTVTRREVPPDALERVVAPKKDVTYEPVTWERTVSPGGGRIVIGTLKSGEHVVLQKPVFDALSSAAGKGGTLVSAGTKKDDRVFAHNAKGEVVGVGMPYKHDQTLARSYARGLDKPAEPETKTPAPEPKVKAPEPDTGKTTPVPAETTRISARDLQPGDKVWSVLGKDLVVQKIVTTKSGQIEVHIAGREHPLLVDATEPMNIRPREAAPPESKGPTPTTETTTAKSLKPGDTIITPGGEHLKVIAVTGGEKATMVRVEGRKTALKYPPNREVTIQKGAVSDAGESVESKTFGPTPSVRKAAARVAAGLQPHRPAPRVRRHKLQPVPRVPTIGAPLTMEDFSHTRAVTHYRDAFHDALAGTGEDAANAANRPITQQIALLSQALKTKYGFKNVIVEPNVEPRITRDQLLNMHHNMQNMAAALGWSNQVISLLGRLQLHLVPRGFNGEHWMGQYAFANNEIGISGGSNSYAHEHWHAIDHYLSDLLNKNPNKTALFSMAGKEGQIDTAADPVQKAFAELLNLLSHDQGALMLKRMMLSNTAMKTDKAGNPTPSAIVAQTQLAMIDRAQTTKLKIPPSPFKAQALAMPKGGSYYAQIYELMARAGEAYTGYVMTAQGMDTAGVVKADAGYRSQTIAYLRQAYPNATDRALIFAGFDKLVVEMQRAGILTAGHTPAMRASEGTTLPMWHDRPPDVGPGFMARLKADIRALRPSELWSADHDWLFTPEDGSPPPLMYDSKGNRPVPKGSLTRGVDNVSRIFGSALGNLERLRRQAPPAARPYVTEVLDRIGVSHEGRWQPITFEEMVRTYVRPTTSEFEDILKDSGLTNRAGRLRLSPTENKHFWHALTTGESRYPVNPDGSGGTVPISNAIMDATGKVRVLMDKAHEYMRTEGGLDVGYPRDAGYAPRVFDDNRILANEAGFVGDMTKLNKVIIDKDLAKEPDADAQVARLAEWWSDSETALKGSAPQAVQDAMKRIVAVQKRIAAIDAELAAGGAGKSPIPNLHDPVKLGQERLDLLDEGRKLYAAHKDAARDHIAKYEAQSRYNAIAAVDPVKFETFGPRSEFLRKRTLPGEADQYLRNWLIQNPRVGLANYFNGVGRKVAYTKMFGEKGDILEGLTQRMTLAGMASEDVDQVARIVELVTGRAMRDKNVAATNVANWVSALGSFMTLSGASISAIGETFGSMMLPAGTAGQRFRFMASSLGKTFGQVWHTADAAERAMLVRHIGGVTSHLQGMASAGRFADYAGTPTLGKVVNAFLELGLGRTIRAMRAALAGSGTDFIRVLLTHAMGPETTNRQKNMKDDAQRMLREWGVPNDRMLELKQWSDDIGDRLPFRSELDTPTGKLFAQALRRLMDRVNVDPGPADKAMGSLQTPMFNMMFALTSFIYTAFRHHIMPSFHHTAVAYERQAERTRALPGGASNARARYEGTTAFARQLGAAVLGAGVLVAGTFLVTMVRNAIFSADTFAKHADDGTLFEWLAGSAMSQSGLGGPPDLIIQALTGLRYHADLSNLTQGAFLAADIRHLIDIAKWAGSYMSGKENSTNTEAYNALYALTQLIYKPAMLSSVAWIAERVPMGGPVATALMGLSVLGASGTTTRGMVNTIAGERGSTNKPAGPRSAAGRAAHERTLPSRGKAGPTAKKDTEEEGGGSATASAVAGFADDALVPLLRFTPGPVKAIGAGVGAAAMFGALLYDASQYNTPPKKHH